MALDKNTFQASSDTEVARSSRGSKSGQGRYLMVRSLAFVCALSTAVMIWGISYAGDNDNQISPFKCNKVSPSRR